MLCVGDALLVLVLIGRGQRPLEAFVVALLTLIFACFAVQLLLSRPELGEVLQGFLPSPRVLSDPAALYLAIGIVGATVMPHNLYLHSGIVQTRAYGLDLPSKREALRLATWDSTIALMFALTINASILILAAAAFHTVGETNVAEIDKAHLLLEPLLGSQIAPILFGLALLCSGLNSTVTATMAGQIVMEGFVRLRLQPWLRRLITRGFAILPATVVILIYGSEGTGQLLILSQVVLSFQLPFAIVPLVMFTASRAKMGPMVSPRWLTALCVLIAITIIVLNVNLLITVLA